MNSDPGAMKLGPRWSMRQWLATAWRDHRPFFLLLGLFAAFRLLTILLFRPGGFIADFSDYDFYYEWGVLTPMGYRAYENLWTAYPPLFPALMLIIFEWSSRIPPWAEPRLFFHVLFGSAMALFEVGNFICIYWLARRVALDEESLSALPLPADKVPALPPGLWAAVLYGFLFTPAYTMAGWFEPMPLFFMLAGLCLLLAKGPWWLLSAVAAGLGFLTKLTPILLLPIAVRWLGARLSLSATRREWFRPASSGNLARPTLYLIVFLTVIIGLGYPLVRFNLDLAFTSFQIQNIRAPWQTVWALLDGYYGWGNVHLSMRNLEGLSGPLWESSLPWTWISAAFVALYIYLYTRPYDWSRARTPIAFAALSVTLLFLYSKGWSPQFLIWILVFIILLLPHARWILAAILLSVSNVVESSVYVIMLPQETYLLVGTVLLRTSLLILLCAELLNQISPPAAVSTHAASTGATTTIRSRIQSALAGTVWFALALAVILAGAAYPRAAAAYQESRLAEHSCRETVLYLQEQAGWPNRTVATQQADVWREFYPWLRTDYDLAIIDGYDTQDRYIETALIRLDDQIAGPEFWWLERTDLTFPGSSPAQVWETYLTRPGVFLIEATQMGPCILRRVLDITDQPSLAQAAVPEASIYLRAYAWQAAEMGDELWLVLYWQADGPVEESYTVFVHLLDASNNLVGQQDNLPVEGLAPTTHWQPGWIIRDPYHVVADGASPPVSIHVGLYNEDGRVQFAQPDGVMRDSIEILLYP